MSGHVRTCQDFFFPTKSLALLNNLLVRVFLPAVCTGRDLIERKMNTGPLPLFGQHLLDVSALREIPLIKSHNDGSMAPVSLPRACASCQCHLGQASLQGALYLRRWQLNLRTAVWQGVTGAQGPNKNTRTSPGGRETCSCKTATSAASAELSATTLATSAACISLH